MLLRSITFEFFLHLSRETVVCSPFLDLGISITWLFSDSCDALQPPHIREALVWPLSEANLQV